MPTHVVDADSMAVVVPDFASKAELRELNLLINRKVFKFQDQAKGGTQSYGYHWHKSAGVLLDDGPVILALAKRMFAVSRAINDAYWGFDFAPDIARPLESMGRAVHENEAGFLANQYGPGDHIDRHVDYMPPLPAEADARRSLNEASLRKAVFVMQLTNPALYIGGALKLRSGDRKLVMPRAAGTAVFFPSFVQHEVSNVEEGIRWTLTSFIFDADRRPFR